MILYEKIKYSTRQQPWLTIFKNQSHCSRRFWAELIKGDSYFIFWTVRYLLFMFSHIHSGSSEKSENAKCYFLCLLSGHFLVIALPPFFLSTIDLAHILPHSLWIVCEARDNEMLYYDYIVIFFAPLWARFCYRVLHFFLLVP